MFSYALIAALTLAPFAPGHGVSFVKGDRLVNGIPAQLRLADVRSPLFRTLTAHEVTPAEYDLLARAARGRIFLSQGYYKVSAASDSRHGLEILERSCCALVEWVLFRPARPPGAEATAADLGTVTIGGIGIGSPATLVMRRFGRAPPVRGENSTLLRYRHDRNHDCATFYTFVVEHGRVSAISVKNAC
jgi:hypothetical protein